MFTSGTAGEPKPIRHGARYLEGQRVQAEHWYGARPGDLCWCTAASGWSLSARNAFVAAWLRGATALLHDARFDPGERLELLERERVDVLCMSPTEYRAIAKRGELRPLPALRHAVAAGEPLNPEVVRAWQEEVGVAIHDGYGQTETGALTGMPIGPPVRPGSMGKPLPGFRAWIDDGELVVDPATVPTFFVDGDRDEPWRTGDRVSEDEDGYLWFEGRTDDVIISAGYRIGPFEVESALVSHPAVAEAAAVAAPDELRGQVVRAVVVLRDGYEPGPELAAELQEHAKRADRALQVPADSRLRNRAAKDPERKDQTRNPPGGVRPLAGLTPGGRGLTPSGRFRLCERVWWPLSCGIVRLVNGSDAARFERAYRRVGVALGRGDDPDLTAFERRLLVQVPGLGGVSLTWLARELGLPKSTASVLDQGSCPAGLRAARSRPVGRAPACDRAYARGGAAGPRRHGPRAGAARRRAGCAAAGGRFGAPGRARATGRCG